VSAGFVSFNSIILFALADLGRRFCGDLVVLFGCLPCFCSVFPVSGFSGSPILSFSEVAGVVGWVILSLFVPLPGAGLSPDVLVVCCQPGLSFSKGPVCCRLVAVWPLPWSVRLGTVIRVVLVVLLFFGGSGLFPRFASLACARSRARHGAVVYLYIYVRIITLSVLNCSI